MRQQLTIAIDFDDTFTADVEAWTAAIKELQRHGHQVICVSARRNVIEHRQELSRSLPENVKVLLSYDMPKRAYAKKEGFTVDIWIDDKPEAIPTKEEYLELSGQ